MMISGNKFTSSNGTNFKRHFRYKTLPGKFAAVLLVTFLINLIMVPATSQPVLADTSTSTTRIAGASRYETAIEISKASWDSADSVVLTRADDFPDALAGAVLAKSVGGPLLLTDTNQLRPEVLTEIQRLHASQVYILGGTGAISTNVENSLVQNNLTVHRIKGNNREETAANIALTAVPDSSQAFLAYGYSFADALSVSSYAAAHSIPLLLTQTKNIPQVTLDTLQKLGVHTITLIGGTGVIDPSLQTQLEGLGYSVSRLAGSDRYATNVSVLNTLSFDPSTVYTATGEDFPDALAGSVMAAKGNNPILLVPSKSINNMQTTSKAQTLSYLQTRRSLSSTFTLFGGWGAISYGIENTLRTGSVDPKISLQYLQAYGSSLDVYLSQLALIPDKATDYVDIVAPNLFSLDTLATGQTQAGGSFTGPWALNDPSYAQLISAAHAKGLKIMPVLGCDWSTDGKTTLDATLSQPAARAALINNLITMINSTGSDGVIIDFEYLSGSTAPYLTQFMQTLYSQLHAQNKELIEAVPARTSNTDWYPAFNYHDLSQSVDYLDVMTYDFSTSTPGPIAPVNWINTVLTYTKAQKVDMSKVLLGLAYYGRDWTQTGTTYTHVSASPKTAAANAATYHAAIQRATSTGDSAGVPYYTYTDSSNAKHTVYYDDLTSWDTKLGLIDTYGLGGVGSWSLLWVANDNAPSIFSLLRAHLR